MISCSLNIKPNRISGLHLKFFSIRTSPFNISSSAFPISISTGHLYHIFLVLQLPTFNPFLPVNVSQTI
ncbi:hypothetical protein MtrunA17_Chr3g0137961 [Medicago truncatula]|uniref:Uncharacterized protein n=1 Tax=Medicago truncatula TaxID=3880 RepID=A0A396IYP7_MEDTR|nr:hypothetical protein MtrunA17_Chr3g0137961 [Medicago truncatula]